MGSRNVQVLFSPSLAVGSPEITGADHPYSTVTDFAKFRGWSTSLPMKTAVW
jgi:hypothetical protein